MKATASASSPRFVARFGAAALAALIALTGAAAPVGVAWAGGGGGGHEAPNKYGHQKPVHQKPVHQKPTHASNARGGKHGDAGHGDDHGGGHQSWILVAVLGLLGVAAHDSHGGGHGGGGGGGHH